METLPALSSKIRPETNTPYSGQTKWKCLHYSQYRTATSLASYRSWGIKNLQLFACSFLSFHTSLIDISDGRWTTLCRSITTVICITGKYLTRSLQEDIYIKLETVPDSGLRDWSNSTLQETHLAQDVVTKD